MVRKSYTAQKNLMFIAMLCVLPPVANTSGSSLERSCATADPVELNRTVRGYASEQEAIRLFSLEVPAAGILALDVTVPGPVEVSPKLGFLGRDCSAPNGVYAAAAIERTAAHQVITVGPGTYFFRLAAQDPRSALGEYKLTTGFLAVRAVDEVLKTEPDIVDPDPGNPFSAPPLKTEPDIVDPDPGNPFSAPPPFKTEPDIVDPDPGVRSIFPDLCQRQQHDDHGDIVTCATALSIGSRVTAEIENSWGDDVDVFTFTLTRAETLHITSSGDTDTFGVLYDRFGQRLAKDTGGGRDGNFRIVKTLVPGQYFVQVEGRDRVEGIYGLSVGTLDW